MSDLANYRKRSLARQVVSLKHRLRLFSTKLSDKTSDIEDKKLIGMVFSVIDRSVEDLFYRNQYDEFSEAIGKHFKVSSEQLEEIKNDFLEMGVLTDADYPTIPIVKKDEPLNYWRIMRELCEDVEKELEEKLKKEGKV